MLLQPHWPSHCIETFADAFPSTWKAPPLFTSLSLPLPSGLPCHLNSQAKPDTLLKIAIPSSNTSDYFPLFFFSDSNFNNAISHLDF